jgi:hypothetical protein
MDGHGRFMDNIFIGRWRSINYEEVHLKAYADGCEAQCGVCEEPYRRLSATRNGASVLQKAAGSAISA